MCMEAALIIFISVVMFPLSIAPPAKRPDKGYIRGCYYTNWSQYRPEPWKFVPENYEQGLCTHLFYAFVVMNEDFTLKAFEWNDEDSDSAPGMYSRVNALKKKQSDLKTLLSFGGWTFSQNHAALMRRMVTEEANRRKFIASTVQFVRRTGFDGFDVDWEYPDWGTKAGYSALIKEMRESFENESVASGKPRLLLTAGVAAGIDRIRAGYDGKKLASSFDFLNVMTYDLHGSWETKTGLNTPLHDRDGDKLSVDSAMSYWSKDQGFPKDKLVVGFATYGRGWTLASSSSSSSPPSIGCAANGPSPAQTYTRETGMAAYYEICQLIESGKFQSQYDPSQKAPFAFKDNVWIGYDDARSFNEKLNWLLENGYAGAFVWALDMDDFLGRCTASSAAKFPLISAIKSKLVDGGTGENSQQVPSSPSASSPASAVISSPKPASSSSASVSNGNTSASSIAAQVSPPTTSPTAGGPFRCSGPGLYPDPSSCTSFYQCDDSGNAYKLPCPAGLHFNADATLCDWPSAAGCEDKSVTTTPDL